jgi:formylglycine-generating enzyme required for sulfatase activity
MQDAIGYLKDNPGAAKWLASVLAAEDRKIVTSSAWYADASRLPKVLARSSEATQAGLRLSVGKLDFKMIPGGLLESGALDSGRVETFYICETVISAAAWEAFLDKQPKWKAENAEALIKEGLVKDDYLKTVEAGFYSQASSAQAEGIAGISWYAARAFCEWLSSSLPPQFASWEIRLPGEAEWEYAAKTGNLNTGQFWEWCEDPFVPLNYLSAAPAAVKAIGSPERSLRGGAWIHSAASIDHETRASLPPSFCSPFISARPVIAPASSKRGAE